VNFDQAFSDTMRREGGYKLHKVEGDTGGMTYAGIARNHNPQWPGWAYIDRNETPPTQMVRDFYFAGYWRPIRGDELRYDIAASIFDFAVNTSAPGRPTVAVKLAQIVAGVEADGVIGPKTVAALNAMEPDKFAAAYFVAKVRRYADIVNRNRSQSKFLLGWLNRSLGALSLCRGLQSSARWAASRMTSSRPMRNAPRWRLRIARSTPP
jgi:lysozyme family protein